jgi:hypothetical protein
VDYSVRGVSYGFTVYMRLTGNNMSTALQTALTLETYTRVMPIAVAEARGCTNMEHGHVTSLIKAVNRYMKELFSHVRCNGRN